MRPWEIDANLFTVYLFHLLLCLVVFHVFSVVLQNPVPFLIFQGRDGRNGKDGRDAFSMTAVQRVINNTVSNAIRQGKIQ